MPFISHGNPYGGKKNKLKFAETRKVFLGAVESCKSPKNKEKLRKLENQKRSHGKLEKVGVSCGNPETDSLLLPPSILPTLVNSNHLAV